MSYVIVDPEGATRARFGSLREVRQWARALRDSNPDLADELLLLTYDAHGDKVGSSQWLLDFVPDAPTRVMMIVGAEVVPPRMALMSERVAEQVLSEARSGTATSTSPLFRRPRTLASETRLSEVAETAVAERQPVP